MMDELLSPLLTTIWGRRAGLCALIGMSFLLFITLLMTVFSWWSDSRLAQLAVKQNKNDVGLSHQLATLIADIPNWHLLGFSAEADFLPITSLQIRLVGVIKATPDHLSRVMISELNQPGKLYQVGDTLPSSGVKIYAITQDGVILENSGRLEKLSLQRTPLQFQGMPKSLLGE
ncbi:MAG: hypothetical protein ACD_45C00253G0003 [uncultured bacterium]|nr:MAG: hypothetical protein ACD_45C00253G0003 [uncultured bacterium]